MKHSIRVGVVAVAICSWLAISNHCAFASLAKQTDSVQTGCPFHSKPVKQEKQSTGAQCCKILRAIATVPAKGLAHGDATFSNVDLFPDERVGSENLRTPLSSWFIDTGPPDALSFAELILQQSLLAHAPPFLG